MSEPAVPDPLPPIWDPADVFGDVLPDQTSDERAGGTDWRAGEDDSDERLRREVPPHY